MYAPDNVQTMAPKTSLRITSSIASSHSVRIGGMGETCGDLESQYDGSNGKQICPRDRYMLHKSIAKGLIISKIRGYVQW
jgi:hypothetical protein